METHAPLLVNSSPEGLSIPNEKISYPQVVSKLDENSTFKLPMRYPVDINIEPSFIFTEPEKSKVVEDFMLALVLIFVCSRPLIDVIHLTVVKYWGILEIPIVSIMDDSNV